MGCDDQIANDPLIAWMDAGDRHPLRQASKEEAAASLRRLMDEQESLPELDSDRLARASWALERAEKRDAPAIAIAWLTERPSHKRLGVVLSLLLVSWNYKPSAPPPNPALVEALLSVYDGLSHEVVSENSLLIVLIRAIRAGLPPPLAARVRCIIERARAMPDRQPEVQAILDEFL